MNNIANGLCVIVDEKVNALFFPSGNDLKMLPNGKIVPKGYVEFYTILPFGNILTSFPANAS